MSQRHAPFRIIACVLACVYALAHLLLALIAATPDPFHLRAPPPGTREYLTAALIGVLGVLLIVGCVLTLLGRRRGLFLLAGIGAVDAAVLLVTVVGHLLHGHLYARDLIVMLPLLLTATALAAAKRSSELAPLQGSSQQ